MPLTIAIMTEAIAEAIAPHLGVPPWYGAERYRNEKAVRVAGIIIDTIARVAREHESDLPPHGNP